MNFFEEFSNLGLKFPVAHQTERGIENCEYANEIYSSKNCYYVFDSSDMIECLYCQDGYKETNDIDCLWNATCEECYETIDSISSNNCYFSQYLANCYNMSFCLRCSDCHDCFGCVNLSYKSYCIFNVQYTKEEYLEELKKFKKIQPEKTLEKLAELNEKFPQVQSNFYGNVNSDYVDYVYNSNNMYYCFDCHRSENCGYCFSSNENKDLWDATYAYKTEQSAEVIDTAFCYNCYEVQKSARCYDSFYLYNCRDCHDCFGCVALSNKQYCILNIQYTKEEYEKKVAELKKELGLYFKEPTTA